jgi:dihydroflavonol-4-reductase
MKVLVTGSTGFIGSHLCRALVEAGEQVRAFHRAGSSLQGLTGLDMEHATGDITRQDTLEPAMQDIEVVFHCAAMLGLPNDPRQMYNVTVQGTRNIMQAARQAGVRRLVHTSSVAALGVPLETQQAASPIPMDEHHTWNFRPDRWRYGHAKYLAELEVQYAVAQGLDSVIVNPAIVIGAGDLNRISGDIIIHLAQGHIPLAVAGGLNAVHIEDVVRGHLAALELGKTGERYILGAENLALSRFLKIIAQVAGVNAPKFSLPARLVRGLARPASAAEKWLTLPVSSELLHKAGYFFYYDTRKAQQELGFCARYSIRRAVAEAYAWYLGQGII